MEQTERELDTAESGTIALISKAEIDQQITTAKKYPRSLKRFRDEALQMVTLSEAIAKECIYALPRRDANGSTKTIEGPSARFAEVIASAWGNCRAGARVVGESPEFVTAQGVFYDLERNVAITYEVQRRITNSKNKRFSTDMIGVTANAACSIALRNAILKGVPKAFWAELYTATRRTIAGDVKTLNNRRADAIKEFAIFGVDEAKILAVLGKAGVQDIGIDDLVTLHGLLTAIRDGDTSPESIFDAERQGIQMPVARTAEPAKLATVVAAQEQAIDEEPPKYEEEGSIPKIIEATIESPTVTVPIVKGAIKIVQMQMDKAKLTGTDLEAAFGVNTVEKLSQSSVNDVLAWAKGKANAPI